MIVVKTSDGIVVSLTQTQALGLGSVMKAALEGPGGFDGPGGFEGPGGFDGPGGFEGPGKVQEPISLDYVSFNSLDAMIHNIISCDSDLITAAHFLNNESILEKCAHAVFKQVLANPELYLTEDPIWANKYVWNPEGRHLSLWGCGLELPDNEGFDALVVRNCETFDQVLIFAHTQYKYAAQCLKPFTILGYDRNICPKILSIPQWLKKWFSIWSNDDVMNDFGKVVYVGKNLQTITGVKNLVIFDTITTTSQFDDQVTTLAVHAIQNLDKVLVNLKTLRLVNQETDLDFTKWTNLEELHLGAMPQTRVILPENLKMLSLWVQTNELPSKLEELTLFNITNTTDYYLPKLRLLSMRDCTGGGNFHAPKLEVLKLESCQLLPQKGQLKTVHVKQMPQITDYDFCRDATEIVILSSNLTQLPQFSNVECITISGCWNLVDVSSLANVKKSLTLENCPLVTDVSCLQNIPSCFFYQMQGITQLTSYSALEFKMHYCWNCEELNIMKASNVVINNPTNNFEFPRCNSPWIQSLSLQNFCNFHTHWLLNLKTLTLILSLATGPRLAPSASPCLSPLVQLEDLFLENVDICFPAPPNLQTVSIYSSSMESMCFDTVRKAQISNCKNLKTLSLARAICVKIQNCYHCDVNAPLAKILVK
jgi:hypothetical protein